MKWEKVKLVEVCNPKQWKTISTEKLTQEGYPVYGANGIIGFYNDYTHEAPTVMITCRGATCGNVHISKPFSYINGNAMALDSLSGNVSLRYLYYYLKSYNFKNIISGSAQPQITIQGLQQLEIPLPPLHIQEQIADTLDKADALRRKDQELLKKYDELAQAVFYDMFGDPVSNERGWDVRSVIEVADCIVPGRDKPKSFTGNIPWVTTDDLKHLGTTINSKKNIGLSEKEIKEVKAKIIPKNSVIMTCVGDLGIVSIAGTNMVINQQLHSFQCKNINSTFLMYALSLRKDYMIKRASSTTVPYMNKTVCNSIPIILPPKELQEKFSSIYKSIIKQVELKIKSSRNSNILIEMFTVKYFS